jgi:hypothetical protein
MPGSFRIFRTLCLNSVEPGSPDILPLCCVPQASIIFLLQPVQCPTPRKGEMQLREKSVLIFKKLHSIVSRQFYSTATGPCVQTPGCALSGTVVSDFHCVYCSLHYPTHYRRACSFLLFRNKVIPGLWCPCNFTVTVSTATGPCVILFKQQVLHVRDCSFGLSFCLLFFTLHPTTVPVALAHS